MSSDHYHGFTTMYVSGASVFLLYKYKSTNTDANVSKCVLGAAVYEQMQGLAGAAQPHTHMRAHGMLYNSVYLLFTSIPCGGSGI